MHCIMCALLSSTFSLVSIMHTYLSYANYILASLYMYIDTAFMFIIAGLLTVKVLQSRHPDLNALAYIAYVCFGVVVFMTLIGIVRDTQFIYYALFLYLVYIQKYWYAVDKNSHDHFADSCHFSVFSVILQPPSTKNFVNK